MQKNRIKALDRDALKAIRTLRAAIGLRDEHHPNCSIKTFPKSDCNCYASKREGLHNALDFLEQKINLV